jgi:hypothetical protein
LISQTKALYRSPALVGDAPHQIHDSAQGVKWDSVAFSGLALLHRGAAEDGPEMAAA